jgi:hypothetical protein
VCVVCGARRYRAVGAVWGAATRATPPLGAAGGITPVRGFAFETKAEEEAAEEATRMTRDFAIIGAHPATRPPHPPHSTRVWRPREEAAGEPMTGGWLGWGIPV